MYAGFGKFLRLKLILLHIIEINSALKSKYITTSFYALASLRQRLCFYRPGWIKAHILNVHSLKLSPIS